MQVRRVVAKGDVESVAACRDARGVQGLRDVAQEMRDPLQGV